MDEFETEETTATLEQPQSYVYSPDSYINNEQPPPVPEAEDMYLMPEPDEDNALS